MRVVLNISWLLFVAAFIIVGAGPVVLLLREATTWWETLLALPLGLAIGTLSLLAIAFVVLSFLPRPNPGSYRLFSARGTDREAAKWSTYAGVSVLYLRVFQPILFQNDWTRFLLLRALHCPAAPSSWVTSRVQIADPRHIRFGPHCVIGDHAVLSPAFQPRPGKLVVGNIEIGARTLISAFTMIGPGVRIGDDCIVQPKVEILPGVTIGAGALIGGATRIDAYARIGAGAKIGRDCLIGARVAIPEDAVIPDGSIVREARPASRS